MRAAVVSAVSAAVGGSSWRMCVEQLHMPVPAVNEALIRVSACGVCHSDLHVLQKDLFFPMPAVLGECYQYEDCEYDNNNYVQNN